MVRPSLGKVLGHLRSLTGADAARELSDRQLLEQFTARQDEAAFEALLRRHGRLVWGVCRNVLHHDQDAEDAFQATFLVLARRAASVRKSEALASWLHGVAYRVALKARRSAARRRSHERQAPQSVQTPPGGEAAWRDLQAALDQEVQGLPERLRGPFVLCCLEGKGPAAAADELGWKVSTVHTRVSEARQELLRRLARRGVSLPAALCAADLFREAAAAAVPIGLAKLTARAALAGAVSARAVALAEGGQTPMALSKGKTILAVAAALALAFASVGLWVRGMLRTDPPLEDGRSAPAAPRSRPVPAPQVARQKKTARDGKKITVSGRVLDPQGKPVRGARVFALDRPARVFRSPEEFSPKLAGETKTDRRGRFRLRVGLPGGQPPPPPLHPLPLICVRARGYGLGVEPVTNKARTKTLVIRLPREQVLRARFLNDMTGKPVQGLVVKVASFAYGPGVVVPPAPLPKAWFPALKTNAQGRLRLRGMGPGRYVFVEWRDARFQPQRLDLWRTEAHQRGQEVVYQLMPPPPKFIHGRVTFQDTGKPAAGVAVRTRGDRTKTDGKGRFRLKPDWEVSTFLAVGAASEYVTTVNAWVEVDAPAGTPYLGGIGRQDLGRFPRRDGTLGPWQMGELRIALPRGVRVRGRVVETGTNKGVSGANVSFGRYQATSGPDGAFSLTTAAGSGHLVVRAGADYAPVEAKVALGRLIAHAVVPVVFKEAKEPKPLRIALRRGVRVKGQLTGPDGKPVRGAVLISRLLINRMMNVLVQSSGAVPTIAVSGKFELRGCHPEKPYPVIFFQEQKGWGALVQVSGKRAGKSLDVRLQRCGAAKARFLTAQGRPLPGRRTAGDLLLVLAPGDTAFWGDFINHSSIRQDWHTDAQGRITWRNLIPGATYRVNRRDFTVRTGEVLDLGDFR
jgi:RNA polymerase sigma factor (sigma-70 family)